MLETNFEELAAANDALTADLRKASDLPTREEVLAAFAASDMGMPDLILEEPLDEFEVIFRASPTWAKELDGEVELNAEDAEAQSPRPRRFAGEEVRCELCQRRAGEVTLVALRANGKKTEHHRCAGGCASQSSLLTALNRQKRLLPRVTLRLTAKGKTLQWVSDGQKESHVEYRLTSRAHARKKALRKQQSASRRANRAR